jgi:ribosomal-protein-serine acetyltransferase
MNDVRLSDGIVLLRSYRQDDIDALLEAAVESVETIYPWMPWCRPGISRSDREIWVTTRAAEWANGIKYMFVIADPLTGRLLGGTGLNHISEENRMANLGYWVRRSAMGHGYAPAAARLAARFGFEYLNLNRIEIIAALGNVASQRAAEKAGAYREGALRSRLFIHGKPHDAVMFSFVRSDFGMTAESPAHLSSGHGPT